MINQPIVLQLVDNQPIVTLGRQATLRPCLLISSSTSGHVVHSSVSTLVPWFLRSILKISLIYEKSRSILRISLISEIRSKFCWFQKNRKQDFGKFPKISRYFQKNAKFEIRSKILLSYENKTLVMTPNTFCECESALSVSIQCWNSQWNTKPVRFLIPPRHQKGKASLPL